MIIKKEHIYTGSDDKVTYELIDDIDRVDVGCDMDAKPIPKAFVTVFRKGNDVPEKIMVEDINLYICNNENKTLQVVRPIKDRKRDL